MLAIERCLCTVVILCAPTALLAQDWKDSLKTQLSNMIAITHTSGDKLRVTDPGTVLVIQQGGISASPGRDATYLNNLFRDGKIQQGGGLAAFMADKKTNRDLKAGEKVYVIDIGVGDNDVTLRLASTETEQIAVKGTTQQTRYKALIRFDFERTGLRQLSFDEVEKTISKLLLVESSATATRTVELGKSIADVEAVMGKPESILKLETKTIYVYKSIKITFVDGRVTDIQ